MLLMAGTALRTKHVALWRDLLARLAVDSMLQVTRVKSRVRLEHDITLVHATGLDITCSFWSAGIVFRGDLKVTPRDVSISETSVQSRDWQRSECQTELCACLIADDLTFNESAVKSTPVSSVSMLTRVYNDTQETDYWQGVTDNIAKLGITLVLVSGKISARGRTVLESRGCMAIEHVSRDSLLQIASVTGVKVTSAKCLPRITARHVTKVSNLSTYKSHTEQLFFIPHAAHASIVLW